MSSSLKQGIIHTMENPKAQAITSTLTTGFGLGTFFNYLPDVLGIIATMSGIILTWVMICTKIPEIKERRKNKKCKEV